MSTRLALLQQAVGRKARETGGGGHVVRSALVLVDVDVAVVVDAGLALDLEEIGLAHAGQREIAGTVVDAVVLGAERGETDGRRLLALVFVRVGKGDDRLGLRFARRSGAGWSWFRLSALAGVEPKKEERKLFFLGSIGAVGIVPAVRIGPPFSSTWPVGEGLGRRGGLLAAFAASGFAFGGDQRGLGGFLFARIWTPLPPPSCRQALRRGGRPAWAGSHRLRRLARAAPRQAAGRRRARRPRRRPVQAPSRVRWSRNRRRAARQEALQRLRCVFPLLGALLNSNVSPTYLPRRCGSDASEPSSGRRPLARETRPGESAARLNSGYVSYEAGSCLAATFSPALAMRVNVGGITACYTRTFT